MKHSLTHEFVDLIPPQLEEGVLYICVKYATAAHSCCCGCGNEVYTPLTPTDWTLIFDGDTVSLDPSIGNWNFSCKSHYWIDRGRVHWARSWSADEIDAGRRRDAQAKGRALSPELATAERSGAGRLDRIAQWLRKRLP